MHDRIRSSRMQISESNTVTPECMVLLLRELSLKRNGFDPKGNSVHVEITAIGDFGVYRIQEGHWEDLHPNKIVICPWVRRLGTAQGHGEDMFLCTSDILGELEQILCRDCKRVTGGVKTIF